MMENEETILKFSIIHFPFSVFTTRMCGDLCFEIIYSRWQWCKEHIKFKENPEN